MRLFGGGVIVNILQTNSDSRIFGSTPKSCDIGRSTKSRALHSQKSQREDGSFPTSGRRAGGCDQDRAQALLTPAITCRQQPRLIDDGQAQIKRGARDR